MRVSKAHKIQAEIDDLNIQLDKYQEKCKHKRATYESGSNTGNYDPGADAYWRDYDCPTCLNTWRVYSE